MTAATLDDNAPEAATAYAIEMYSSPTTNPTTKYLAISANDLPVGPVSTQFGLGSSSFMRFQSRGENRPDSMRVCHQSECVVLGR